MIVSDDAAVYRGFSKAQKCWAHLLRKAIRLTLLEPENAEYRRFLDGRRFRSPLVSVAGIMTKTTVAIRIQTLGNCQCGRTVASLTRVLTVVRIIPLRRFVTVLRTLKSDPIAEGRHTSEAGRSDLEEDPLPVQDVQE